MSSKLQLLLLTVFVVAALTFGDEDVDDVEFRSRRNTNPNAGVYRWTRRVSSAPGDYLEEVAVIPKLTSANGAGYVLVQIGKPGEPKTSRDTTFFGFRSDSSITIFKRGALGRCFGLRTNNDIGEIRNILEARNGTVIPANAPSINLYLDARGSVLPRSKKDDLFRLFPGLKTYCGSVPIVITSPLKTRPSRYRGAAINTLRGKVNVVVG